jgi:hypothetical protein
VSGGYEAIYADGRAAVLAALAASDDRTTLAEARHLAHDAVFAILGDIAEEIRDLADPNLESVLLLLGQRP